MREMLLGRWSELGDKIVAMAEEFPEDRYDAVPTPGIRSFADQLRHVAFWNEYVEQSLRGATPDGAANELAREAFASKARVLAALRQSFDGVKSAFAHNGSGTAPAAVDQLVSFIEHNGEHYGQLVMYYRLNGLVPPASRA